MPCLSLDDEHIILDINSLETDKNCLLMNVYNELIQQKYNVNESCNCLSFTFDFVEGLNRAKQVIRRKQKKEFLSRRLTQIYPSI